MWPAFLLLVLFIGCEVTEGPRQVVDKGFIPPENGRITEKMANSYIESSKFLLESIKNHEKSITEFAERYNLSQDLSELADSSYREKHKNTIKAWDELVKSWENIEKEAYKKVGISEEEFNWIGGALTDPINKDIQDMVAKQLSE